MLQPTTYKAQPIAPGIQICAACYCTKQQDIKSNTEENDAIKRHTKDEICEAAADITYTVFIKQYDVLFFIKNATFFISKKSTI